MQAPGSKHQAPSSKSQVPRSKLRVPSSTSQAPSSKRQASNSELQAPSSKLQVPSSKFQARSSKPSCELQVANSKLQAPSSKGQAPELKAYMATRPLGYRVARLHGCLVAQLQGCTATRLRGRIAAGLQGYAPAEPRLQSHMSKRPCGSRRGGRADLREKKKRMPVSRVAAWLSKERPRGSRRRAAGTGFPEKAARRLCWFSSPGDAPRAARRWKRKRRPNENRRFGAVRNRRKSWSWRSGLIF